MKIRVFLGPTLTHKAAHAILPAEYLPPVSQGDVYEAARAGVDIVGIIDGYFERVPAVWHREILWAMANGVHVFGSASMGALRAAELHAFGMVGVGEIFVAYANGAVEDDDEVAIVHGTAESDYRPASEAMVNVRATVNAAVRAGVVGADTAALLIAGAKSLFYPYRHYAEVLRLAAEAGAALDELSRFQAWLPDNKVDQKRTDAVAMLTQMAAFAATAPKRKSVSFHFQHTDAWEQVRRQIERRPLDVVKAPEQMAPDAVLDELRLRPDTYKEVSSGALQRQLALWIARNDGDDVSAGVLEHAIERFRREHGLLTEAALDRWTADMGWSRETLVLALQNQALAERVLTIHRADLDRHLADELRLLGEYAELAERARRKQNVLAQNGLDEPSGEDLHIEDSQLWAWFYQEVARGLAATTPAEAAAALRFESLEGLRRLALRELAFRRLAEGPSSVPPPVEAQAACGPPEPEG